MGKIAEAGTIVRLNAFYFPPELIQSRGEGIVQKADLNNVTYTVQFADGHTETLQMRYVEKVQKKKPKPRRNRLMQEIADTEDFIDATQRVQSKAKPTHRPPHRH